MREPIVERQTECHRMAGDSQATAWQGRLITGNNGWRCKDGCLAGNIRWLKCDDGFKGVAREIDSWYFELTLIVGETKIGKILPFFGFSIKLIIFNKLVFPEPDDPIIATFCELDKTKSILVNTFILFLP